MTPAKRRARTERWAAAVARSPAQSDEKSLCTSSARVQISSATHASQRPCSGPQTLASSISAAAVPPGSWSTTASRQPDTAAQTEPGRSEEHTSELQSRQYLVCRLLFEK